MERERDKERVSFWIINLINMSRKFLINLSGPKVLAVIKVATKKKKDAFSFILRGIELNG